jgi:putative nucleotidyltransferase with HDIG domain
MSQYPFYIYLIPTTISSMLLGILFDSGVGVVGTTVIALLLGSHMEFNFSFTVLSLIVGVVAIYSVTHIRLRNHIFKAILYILMAYFFTLFAFGMMRYDELYEIFETFLYMIPNAILSGFITYMSLGIFERIFDITTDITLLELSDLNHPLLKELTQRAPGTFHHSIIVGNLAEAGAKAINANSLLARVGSYYHDIGKINKPEYFIENQKGSENRHDSLAPNMSALILSTHVKEGIEMAEEYKLPKLIRDFIPEHHGHSLMKYFYNRATKVKDAKEINEADYRYPGPRPQSKETAIVMIADTIEAATRTIKNPSPNRIRKLVEDLVEEKFLSGELDDSELTMRDLNSIIDGFMSVLLGIYHDRVEYPDAKKRTTKNGNSGLPK